MSAPPPGGPRKRRQNDVIEYRQPDDIPGVGAQPLAGQRLRLMITHPRLGQHGGVPIAYQEMMVADAVQVVQAIRQAIDVARKGPR